MGRFAVEPIDNNWYLVTDGEQRWRVAVAGSADVTWVFVNGQVARIDPPSEGATRQRVRGRGETSVMSPMPATVVAVKAEAGQAVQQGDTLLVLEAMKMELTITAPRNGVVKAVHCAKGELVQPGVDLIEFAE